MINYILGKWFFVSPGHLPQKPRLFTMPKGIMLGEKMVHTILYTNSIFNILKTDADAVLVDYFLYSDKNRLNSILSCSHKPLIFRIRNAFLPSSRLSEIIKNLEKKGASGFYTGYRFPISKLVQMCAESSIPVFSASESNIQVINSKIIAGAFAVCLYGRNVSRELICSLEGSPEQKKVIAICNRSEKLLEKCVFFGVDAVIFQPCVPFEAD